MVIAIPNSDLIGYKIVGMGMHFIYIHTLGGRDVNVSNFNPEPSLYVRSEAKQWEECPGTQNNGMGICRESPT